MNHPLDAKTLAREIALELARLAPTHVLRLPVVCDRCGLSPQTVYALEAAGKFPKRIPLTKQASGWLAEEVSAWIRARAASREELALRESPSRHKVRMT